MCVELVMERGKIVMQRTLSMAELRAVQLFVLQFTGSPFPGFAHKFIHSDVASVLQLVSKVLEVLGSTELLGLIYNVDAAYILDFLVRCHVFWIMCSSTCHQSVSSYRTGKTDCRNMMLMDLSCICVRTLT